MRFLNAHAPECRAAFDVLQGHMDLTLGGLVPGSPGQAVVQDAVVALFALGYTPDTLAKLLAPCESAEAQLVLTGHIVLALQQSVVAMSAELLKALKG